MEKGTALIDKYVAAAQSTKEKKYWLNQLSGELVKSNFYYDIKAKNVDIRNFEKEEFRVTGQLFSKFLQLSSDSDLRLHMILTAGLVILIEKYTGEKDIIVGAPVYKEDEEVKFLNTVLVLRNIIDTGKTFKEILVQVRQTILEAVEHVNYPVELLAEELGMMVSNQTDFPLFDIVILLENIQDKKYIEHINYNIGFFLSRKEDAIEGVVEYNARRYHKETFKKMIKRFISIFRQVLFDVNLKISRVDIITEAEKRKLLNEFNDTRAAFPKDKTIHELFEEQAGRTSGAIAVGSPMDISDIFTAASCFKKNPYIFSSDLGSFKILKTNTRHSVVINENMLKLIVGFTGENNLESIFSILKDFKSAAFIVFTSEEKDLLGITHDFNRPAHVFSNMNYKDFISLVKLLHKNHLIEFHGIKPHKTIVDQVEPGYFELDESFDDRTVLKDIIKYKGAGLVKADVLLLGDTHGMPTTGLLYLGSFLRRHGVKTLCRFYDDTDDSRSMAADIEEMLARIQPRVVGISMKWFLYIARVTRMCKIIKEYSRRQGVDIKVVVGGNTAAYYWEEVIKYDCIDYLVRGDGEEPLLKIFRGEKDVPNCIYRESGTIIENPITYIQDEKNSSEIYLSHLDEILVSNAATLFGSFYIYTQKGCALNCLYCGGCNQAQQKTFNREFVLRRGVGEVRKDITEVKKYTSAFHFQFDIPGKNLVDYCRKIWEGIDLSGHFCFFSTLTPPSNQLLELVSGTFKYVYWDFDICTPSQRHRKQLESLGLVKPQLTDAEIMEFMTTCENFKNIEVRPNLITGLPYFTLADLEPGEKLLTTIMTTLSCSGEWHGARLHAQPGAPILEYAEQLQMHSFAASFEDFLKYSQATFNRDSGYVSVENFNYPYIYFKDDHLNSRVTNFYLEIDKKINQYKKDKTNDLIISETLTYGELNQRARRLAAALISRGVKPGDIVGLMLPRSQEMIVGILGILKAGGAYMPIDPDYPPERIDYMLKDSSAKVLVVDDTSCASWLSIASKALLNLSAGHHLNFPASQFPGFPASLPSSLAYIIYTSGSSGRPKGVMVGHRNAANLLAGLKERIYNAYSGYLRVALLAPFVFDASIKQIFGALLQGHGLYIVPGTACLDSSRLRRFFHHYKIDITDATPAHVYMLSESETPAPGKSIPPPGNPVHFIVGGDVLSPRLVERFYNSFPKDHCPKITNIYGPTECTVDSTCFDVPADRRELYANLPIGKPLANHFIYILNGEGRLQPMGAPGELCIAGEGVARGYLNQPELTAEKFKRAVNGHSSLVIGSSSKTRYNSSKFYPRPYALGSRLYHTGDLARWLPQGDIEFLDRIDNQVKIRGYRIELGEIENRLTKHPEVEEAVVVVKELNESANTGENGNDNKHICAYVVPPGENPPAAAAAEKIKKIPRTALAQFSNHVKTKYDEIAVKSITRSLTYSLLNNASNRLSHQVLAEYDDRYKLSKNERIRYKRQMLLHGWSLAFQEKLKSTTVFVAGAGGGASPTIMQLALMGIGTIKICDFDEVELSNLNRQFLHDVERIGMNKAQSAKVLLERINPQVTIIPIKERLTLDNVFEMVGDADIIFDMMDGPADKFTLSQCAVVKRIPHVIIAMADLNGYATILQIPHTPCYHCLFSKEKLDAITNGMKNYVENYSKNPLAVVPAPLLMSSGAVINEVIKILMGVDEPAYNKLYYFNQRGANKNLKFTPSFKSMTHLFSDHFRKISREQGFDWDEGWRGNLVEVLDIRPDPGCALCSDRGKELRKALEQENKKAASVVNIEEKNKVNKQEDSLKTVGILLEHDIPMAAAVMAALKAGKTMVPLDPDAPEKSLDHVLEDSELRVILTDDRHLEIARRLRDKCNPNIKIIKIEPLDDFALSPEKALPVSENVEINPAPIACLLYPADPMGNPGINTAFVDLYNALVVTAKPYTFGTAHHKSPAGEIPLSQRLRDYLLEGLPGYMIPSFFVQLDKIPLTPNGKVDKKALPGPEVKKKSDYTTPGNQLEKKLAGIWAEVLGIKKDMIGIDSNFFAMGGHSLSATLLVSKIHKELKVKFPLAEFFRAPTIKGLTRYIQDAPEKTFASIAPVEEKEYYQLSSAQKRIYILQQMGENNTVYNMHQEFPLSRDVDKEKLAAIFNRLLVNHETLRTYFRMVGGEPVQEIHKNIELSLQHYKTDETGLENVRQNFTRAFDLTKAPLLRVGLVEIEKPSLYCRLLVETHHIISDEVSQTLLQKEFIALSRGQAMPPLKLQYKDFAEWENCTAQQETVKKQEAYWLKQFDGQLPVLNLPLDFPRPAVQSNEGCTVSFHLPLKDSAALRTIAHQEEVTIFMILLTVYNLFLTKLCCHEDIIVGAPMAGRKHSDLQKIMGVFINSLALRNFPMGEKTVREFLKEVKTNTLEAFENQEYPFEDLVEKVLVERDAGRNPIFDVMLNLLNREDYLNTIPGDDNDYGDSYTHVKGRVRFDMNLIAVDFGERIFYIFFYCKALFKPETIERYIGYFKKLVSQLPRNLDRRIEEIDILSEAEKQQLLLDFNAFTKDYTRDKTIMQLFEEQVCGNPDVLVLVFEDKQITYRHLNDQANRLGRLLRSKGVKPDNLVSLMVQRSVEMVVGILGILKSGGAYLPINPEAPGDRITYMLDNASVNILLTQEKFIEKFDNRYQVINLNSPASYKDACSNLECTNVPTDLAYVIYTSGSTGNPKGVMIENRSVINIIKWFAAMYRLGPGFNLLQMFEYTFDASVNQIFGSLLHGVTLHIIKKEYFFDIEFLREYIIDHCINLINFVQSVIKELLCGRKKLKTLEYVISGAEKLKSSIKNDILNNGYALYNQYGPTEVTVDALAERCSYDSDGTVGKPVYNARCYIVNKYCQLNPVGAAGELWVSGDGLARGYVNNVELTAKKFIPNPFFPARPGDWGDFKKVYKTGDLTRWLETGSVEFLGRIDNQVKIRGFRIEPVEIASQLVKIEGIKEAVVIDREDSLGDTYLCAYLVGDGQSEVSEIKKLLTKTLPDYMIPSYYVWIEGLPLSGHGKLVRSALPEPDLTPSTSGDYAAPTNKTEKKLVEIWSDVLNVQQQAIGIDSDFFELGGHSLKAVILMSKIHKELDVKVPLTEVFSTPTVKGLAAYIKKAVKDIYLSLEAVEKKEYYPLSSAQKRIYIIDRMDPQSIAYNMHRAIPLGISVDKQRLENVFRELINRHDSLRTSFHMIDETPVQRIHHHIEFNVEYDEPGMKTLVRAIHDFVRAFDLSTAPLVRGRVVKTGEGPHYLLVDMHHIISDGSSRVILDRDFSALYRGEKLPLLKLQYKDFSQWQNKERRTDRLKRKEKYWLKAFAGEIPVLDLPTDYPRPVIKSFEGSSIDFELNPGMTHSLLEYAQNQGVTLYMMLLAAANILLSKLSGQEDIVLGTPVAGRDHADLEEIIGMFINTLVLRNSPVGCLTFRKFLGNIKEKVLEAFENQEYPFEEILDKLSVQRDIGRNPLFDVMLLLQNFYMPTAVGQKNKAPGTVDSRGQEDDSDSYEDILQVAKFDLALNVVERDPGLFLSFQYCTKLFKKETIERYIVYFKKIISIAAKEPGIKICEIEIISEEEKKRILFDFNNTQTEYPKHKTIHRLFEEQVERTPGNIVVIGSSVLSIKETFLQITCKELNEKSNQLAHLLQTKGVGPDTIVGIMVERSIEMVTGILGILKAGGAYMPIEPGYPPERINYMLTDSNVKALVGDNTSCASCLPFAPKALLNLSEGHHLNFPASQLPSFPASLSSSLAYVIYTSGSSGRPKGVIVEHRNVARLVKNAGYIDLSMGDRLLATGPVAFDINTFEVWGPLLNRGTLLLASRELLLNAAMLKDFLQKYDISVLHLIPQLFNQLAAEDIGIFARLRCFLIGGDLVKPGAVNRLRGAYPRLKILHCYGPTENTTFSTTFPVEKDYDLRIPIGKPIGNTSIYIVDKYDHLLPVGVPGELCVGGDGVARGYLNNPGLTAEKFDRDLWGKRDNRGEEKKALEKGTGKGIHWSYMARRSYIYRTGDLGRWLDEGNIEFLGRIDNQIKIRGFRIELGEIETQLLECPGIDRAVVIDRETGEGKKFLCAYLVSEKEPDISQLRGILLKTLPDYMIPSYFIQIERIPLTANGKIDRKALNSIGMEMGSRKEYAEPRNEIEQKIAQIWKEVLKLENVGIYENFFDVGGTSLDIIKLNVKFKEVFNEEETVVQLFRYPTIRSFGEYLIQKRDGTVSNDNLRRSVPINKVKKTRKNQKMRRKKGGISNG